MKKVKNRCKKCGYSEEYTPKEKFFTEIKGMVLTILIVLGIITLFVMIIIGPYQVIDIVGNSIMIGYNKKVNFDNSELREFGINVTQKCRDADYNADSWCYGVAVYKALEDIDYVPASKYTPIQKYSETLASGGDCKAVSLLYTNIMKSLGFHARIDCNIKEGHCVSVLPHYDGSTYLNNYAVIDLTIPDFYSMRHGDQIWNYMDNGLRLSLT